MAVVLSFLAWFTGKTGEKEWLFLSSSSWKIRKKSGVLAWPYSLPQMLDFNSFIAWTVFLVTWGVTTSLWPGGFETRPIWGWATCVPWCTGFICLIPTFQTCHMYKNAAIHRWTSRFTGKTVIFKLKSSRCTYFWYKCSPCRQLP